MSDTLAIPRGECWYEVGIGDTVRRAPAYAAASAHPGPPALAPSTAAPAR